MSEQAVSDGECYAVGFRLGLWGCVLLALVGFLTRSVVALVGIAAWTLLALFVFPWCYRRAVAVGVDLPWWLIRGPHQ